MSNIELDHISRGYQTDSSSRAGWLCGLAPTYYGHNQSCLRRLRLRPQTFSLNVYRFLRFPVFSNAAKTAGVVRDEIDSTRFPRYPIVSSLSLSCGLCCHLLWRSYTFIRPPLYYRLLGLVVLPDHAAVASPSHHRHHPQPIVLG